MPSKVMYYYKEDGMQATGKITSKGQITLPVAVRRLLNLKEGGVVVFEGDESGVSIKPAASLISMRGTVKSNKKSLPWSEVRKTAKEAVGRRIAG